MNYPAFFLALGDENRLRILQLLMQKPLCVCEVETLLGLTQSNASRHLNKLRAVGLLHSDKDAQWVHYAIHPDLQGQGMGLLTYLEKIFKEMPSCVADLQQFKAYEAQCLTCKDIKKDAEAVKIKIGFGRER